MKQSKQSYASQQKPLCAARKLAFFLFFITATPLIVSIPLKPLFAAKTPVYLPSCHAGCAVPAKPPAQPDRRFTINELVHASCSGNLLRVRECVVNGVDVNSGIDDWGPRGFTPLMGAAQYA